MKIIDIRDKWEINTTAEAIVIPKTDVDIGNVPLGGDGRTLRNGPWLQY